MIIFFLELELFDDLVMLFLVDIEVICCGVCRFDLVVFILFLEGDVKGFNDGVVFSL